MPNPYAAKRRRSRTARATSGTFPAGRLRKVGASDYEVGYWRDLLGSLDATDRADQLAAWDAMTDDELADDVRLESLTGTPGGVPVEGRLEVTLDEVPDGTVDDVLAWVGQAVGDERAARGRAALEVEQSRDNPRTGVTGPLEAFARG